ncbi:MAG: acetyl-CoA carboxylase biotin carboxylase subunit [Myxococcota bacterium]
MFKKILVANRGEIALRVIRAARELGVQTVAVYSTADAESLHVKFADEAVCIGPPLAKESYLSIPAIISAAEITAADAIHPGYGFLSENANFAEACRLCGFKFIGPEPALIRTMGDKIAARTAMVAAGMPILPGSSEPIDDPEVALKLAREIGVPLIIKAAAGGGGRGMKIVHEEEHLARSLEIAKAEAEAAFGNGSVYIERYVQKPRHIEFQIVADEHGNVVHLGERECSVQRRHQKLIEEAPSPAVTEELRMRMGGVITAALKKLGYTSVGTVELLMDERGDLYFMEMNTRIQVEHPVTEEVTGIDLVRLQIEIAAGKPLPFTQSDVRWEGHAIECRINAEDPETFAPSPGPITAYHMPCGAGVRIESFVTTDTIVQPHYDSMVAKLIVKDKDRQRAIIRMRGALRECVVEGIKTNVAFHRRAMSYPDFVKGQYDTRIVERMLASG